MKNSGKETPGYEVGNRKQESGGKSGSLQAKRIDVVSVKLVREKSFLYKERKVGSPKEAYEIAKDMLQDKDREVLLACFLNTKNEPIAVNVVSVGSLNSSIIHPREIFKVALLCNAASFILFHNHPSGSVEPSSEDISATQRIKECGVFMGISLIDHIIVGDEKFYSMLENGMF